MSRGKASGDGGAQADHAGKPAQERRRGPHACWPPYNRRGCVGRREECVDAGGLAKAVLALEIVDGADSVEVRNHGGLLSDGEANWPTDTIGKSPGSNTGEITGFLRLPYGTFGPT